jgi:hypothetical protein
MLSSSIIEKRKYLLPRRGQLYNEKKSIENYFFKKINDNNPLSFDNIYECPRCKFFVFTGEDHFSEDYIIGKCTIKKMPIIYKSSAGLESPPPKCGDWRPK